VLAASAPLVTRHGHRPAACIAFALAAAILLLLSRVAAHDADALDLVPAMLLVALGLRLGLPALQGTAPHGSAGADAGLAAGVIACVQQLGAAAGLAVLTALAFRRVRRLFQREQVRARRTRRPHTIAAVANASQNSTTLRRQVYQRSLPAQAVRRFARLLGWPTGVTVCPGTRPAAASKSGTSPARRAHSSAPR
jgi:hypothetical protein